MRWIGRWLGGFFLLAGVMVWQAHAAGAVVTDPCDASGVITEQLGEGESGPPLQVNVTPKTRTGVYTVPYEGSVDWRGSVGTGETEPRSHNGEVRAEFPPVINDVMDLFGDVGVWTWGDDDATTTSDTGTETYEIPSWVPGGAEVVVAGFHNDSQLGECTGAAVLKLPGDAWESPVTWGVLVATAGSVLLVVVAGRARGGA